MAARGGRHAAADGPLAVGVNSHLRAGVGPLTFKRLKWTSFTHSCVYTALLVSAFALANPSR